MAKKAMESSKEGTSGGAFAPANHFLKEEIMLFERGSILHHVQVSDVLVDGKEFVDRPALCSPFTIVANWNTLLAETKGRELKNKEILDFISKHFGESGWELAEATPKDLLGHPTYLKGIKHKGLKNLGEEIQKLWVELGKVVRPQVKQYPTRTSMLYIPNVFVIPGGRFKEIYYWDTYWIVKAFMRSGAFDTARGVIENYFYLIRKNGFIPNGNRKYYLDRSQPPFLISMVKDYVEFSKDSTILESVDFMLQEMEWFEENRRVEVVHKNKAYDMFHYSTNGSGPRPESYKEDLEAVHESKLKTEEEKEELHKHIRAGAESGWDFSSRWVIDSKGGCTGGMESIKAKLIIPVDLNSLMYKNYATLAGFLNQLDRQVESKICQVKADQMKTAVMSVLFDSDSKTWRDYDMSNKKQRDFYYASNIFPLWADCYPEERAEELGEAAAEYLTKSAAVKQGGLLTSNVNSGMQWDAPNCWPPLQEIAVTGLIKSGGKDASAMAHQIASNFTATALKGCEGDECELYEKYHEEGRSGGGGEYEVQTGFGWTNGVLVEFMAVYGDSLLDKQKKDDLAKGKLKAPHPTDKLEADSKKQMGQTFASFKVPAQKK